MADTWYGKAKRERSIEVPKAMNCECSREKSAGNAENLANGGDENIQEWSKRGEYH